MTETLEASHLIARTVALIAWNNYGHQIYVSEQVRLGAQFKKYRQSAEVSRNQISVHSGMTAAAIMDLENGGRLWTELDAHQYTNAVEALRKVEVPA